MTDDELITLARAASLKAHAPYSNFFVGCAIESVDGEVVTGANMENACYRLGICAEQSALTAAQHAFGLAKVAKIVVVGGPMKDGTISDTGPCTPCGGCRQAILEAAQLGMRDIVIVCGEPVGDERRHFTISQLMPNAFGADNLG
jgi:cytidine deaminase